MSLRSTTAALQELRLSASRSAYGQAVGIPVDSVGVRKSDSGCGERG